MLSKDNTLSYTHPPIVAETSAHPRLVSAIVMQDNECPKSEQASCGTENQGVTSSALPSPDHLQVDNDVRTDMPPLPTAFPKKGLDEVTRTQSSGCLDLANPPSILVTLSVHGDDWGQVGTASRSKDDGDPATMSTGDIPLRTSNGNVTLSQSSASSLRTLTDTQSSVTLLNSTSSAPPRRLFKGSSLRISRTYNDSTEDSVNDPPLSDHLRVPSLDTRSHSAPSPAPNLAPRKSFLTQTPPTAMSWLTDKSYGITPPFTRLAINAPGVVLPLTAREYQRQQHLKEFEKMRKEDVVDSCARSKLSFAGPFSTDRFHGTIQPPTCGITARCLDNNTLVPMDSSSCPRIFGNRTEINQRVVLAEEVQVPVEPRPLQQQQSGCTCETGRSCLCRRMINRRVSKIRRKGSEEESGTESKGVGNKRTGTISVLMKIVSKFNRSTG